MELYIIYKENKILYRGIKQIPNSIKIENWPIDPEEPDKLADKKDCYYPGTGSVVLLKEESMIVGEKRAEYIKTAQELLKNNTWEIARQLKVDSSPGSDIFEKMLNIYDVFYNEIEQASSIAEVESAWGKFISSLSPA